jgi:hypothetical protein
MLHVYRNLSILLSQKGLQPNPESPVEQPLVIAHQTRLSLNHQAANQRRQLR